MPRFLIYLGLFNIYGSNRAGLQTNTAFIAVFQKFYPCFMKEHGVLGTNAHTGTAMHA
jgi:hypothetical protein